MKRILSVIVAVIMMSSFAFAEEYDFSALKTLTYDDLVILQKAVEKEIMSRPEWKEVDVPSGDWKVGEDIPAGTYSIKTNSFMAMVDVWKKEKNDYTNQELSAVLTKDSPIGKVELKDGWTVSVTYSVIFSPFVSLGF